MTVFGTIAGREFREIAASARYPFEDTGTMRATDGREIPDSVFLDAVIYPEDGTFGRVWIFGIKTTAEGRLDIGLMKDGLAMGSCIMSPEEGTGHVKSASGLVCGTLVTRKDGLAYVAGLASYSTLFFNRDALGLTSVESITVHGDKGAEVLIITENNYLDHAGDLEMLRHFSEAYASDLSSGAELPLPPAPFGKYYIVAEGGDVDYTLYRSVSSFFMGFVTVFSVLFIITHAAWILYTTPLRKYYAEGAIYR